MDSRQSRERGILKQERRERGEGAPLAARAVLTPQGSWERAPVSPQPSVDRLSVTWAEPEGRMASPAVNLFHLPSETAINNNEVFSAAAGEGSDDEDYSASLSAVLRQRRASVRRSRKGRRRPSSPFVPDEPRARRRSSALTISSGETAISLEEGPNAEVTQEQIFENIHLHKEVLVSVKQQPFAMRKKLKIVHQAKTYIKKHEGQLQERLAQSKSTRDIYARFNILMATKLQQIKREAANMSNLLIPWELRIKEIESHFGSVVASYFTFLRWLFWVNLVIGSILMMFVIVPEYVTANSQEDGERKIMMEEERQNATNLQKLWEFEGVLKCSPIFYGYYTNIERPEYRMPLAYFLTGLVVYIYSFVATLRKMAENSRMSKLSEKEDECVFSWKLFTGWDYMIGNAETAHNRIASVILGFKEALLEEAEKKKDLRNWRVISLRAIVSVCVVILLAVSAYAVVAVVSRSDDNTSGVARTWWSENETTIVVTVISITFPYFFELLGYLERYHPRKQLRLQLARIMLLNLLNLYSLIFALISKIGGMSNELAALQPILDINATVSPPTTLDPVDAFASTMTTCVEEEVPCLSPDVVFLDDNYNLNVMTPFTIGADLETIETVTKPIKNIIQNNDAPNVYVNYPLPLTKLENSDENNNKISKDESTLDEFERIRQYIREYTKNYTSPEDDYSENNETDNDDYELTTSIDSVFTNYNFSSTIWSDNNFTSNDIFNQSITNTSENYDDVFNNTSETFLDYVPYTTTEFDNLTDFMDNATTIEPVETSTTNENTESFSENENITDDEILNSEFTTESDREVSEETNRDSLITTSSAPGLLTTTTISDIDYGLKFTESRTLDPAVNVNKAEVTTSTEINTVRCPSLSFNTTSYCGNSNETHVYYIRNCTLVEKICYITKCTHIPIPTSTSTTVAEQKKLLTDFVYIDDKNRKMYSLSNTTKRKLLKLCWETMFGQELVKLTMMDLVFVLLGTLFMDFFRALFVRFMNRIWCWDLEKTYPEYGDFKIAENILHLINNQGMVWMGMFFAPGLVVLNVFKLVILMYLRSWAVMTCNVPHEVVFRVSKSNNFYLALLLTMLFLCVLPVGFSIVWLKPSWHCGPFSEYERIYHILTKNIYKILPSTLHFPMEYIVSPAIVIPLLVLLILIIYYLTSLTNSLREANNDLKIQLRRERTEERRKMIQLADRGCRPSAMDNSPFARWKRAMPSLHISKSIDSDDKKNNGDDTNSPKKSKKHGADLLANIVSKALDKKSDIMSAFEMENNLSTSVNADDETDTDFHETLPKEVLKIKDIVINKIKPKSTDKKQVAGKEEKSTEYPYTKALVEDIDEITHSKSCKTKESKKLNRQQNSESSTQSKQSDSRVIPVITISTTESDDELLQGKERNDKHHKNTKKKDKVISSPPSTAKKGTSDLKSLRRQSSVDSIKVKSQKEKPSDSHKYQYSL